MEGAILYTCIVDENPVDGNRRGQEDCKVDGRLPGGNVRYSAPAHQSAIADAAARLPTRTSTFFNFAILVPLTVPS